MLNEQNGLLNYCREQEKSPLPEKRLKRKFVNEIRLKTNPSS